MSAAEKDRARSVDFTTIVLSLRHIALLSLGLMEDDEALEQMAPDAGACRMQVEMLEVLQEKTAGNLSDDENKLLESVLYELRTAYVQHAGPRPSADA